MTKRVLAIAALSAPLVLLAAGCGGDQFPQSTTSPTSAPYHVPRDPHAVVLASVQRTSALKSARLALSMQLVGGGAGSMTVTGTGVFDFVDKAASLSLHGEGNGQPVSAEMRLIGGTVYERTGTAWQSLPVSDTDVGSPDPEAYLTYLKGVSSAVRVEGHDTVRGVGTTRYGARIDLESALSRAMSPAERSAFERGSKLTGDVSIPVTVWIDGDGHLRKMQLSLSLALTPPASASPRIVVVLELYDFGIPVHVTAPVSAGDLRTAAANEATQSDLRDALTAEKTYYTDQEQYSADPALMRSIESSLDWGGKLTAVVGHAGSTAGQVVCLSEATSRGAVFSIADIAMGPSAGTYYGHAPCPPVVDDAAVAALGRHW